MYNKIPTQKDVITVIKDTYNLIKDDKVQLGLFGSYARGDYNKQSDIDLVFKEETKDSCTLSFGEMADIRKIIKHNLNKSMDIVDYWRAKEDYESRDTEFKFSDAMFNNLEKEVIWIEKDTHA